MSSELTGSTMIIITAVYGLTIPCACRNLEAQVFAIAGQMQRICARASAHRSGFCEASKETRRDAKGAAALS